jgi:hypothetical protein
MFITGNYFVIVTPRKDKIFDVFTYPGLDHLFSDGVRGGGPDDFLSIDRRCPAPAKHGFNVFLMDSKKYREVGIDATNKRLYTIREHKYPFLSTADLVNGFMPLNDHEFIFYDAPGSDTEYCLARAGETATVSFSPYPGWSNGNPGEHDLFAYLKGSTARPDGKRFATFYAYFKRWRVFDSNGTLTHDISVEIPPCKPDSEDPRDKYTYYSSPFSTDKYIYAFCRNQKGSAPRAEETELQVWDWDGNPVARFTLDKYISCFTVDEQRKTLYGANSDEGNEETIFTYTLPLD